MSKPDQPTDTRKIRRRSEQIELWLVLILLIVVGGGLIGLIWGLQAALVGGICLISGGAFIMLLWALLVGLEKFVDRE
ncbi:MAG: hypothetical protein H6631_06375 [Anaerolineaceae bacterium]|nr:hypothetical protein [Anaerolineaceae bacterium]MCB9101810.1 hypothetical protein [Anaerolineales bacterium]